MQRIHVRNLFSLFVPFTCPLRAKVVPIEDLNRNSVGFNLTDNSSKILNKFELELFIFDEKASSVYKLEKNCFSLAKRNSVSIQHNYADNNIQGILVQLRVDPGVFDFRKLKKEQMCQIRLNCRDELNILLKQATSATFLIYRKKRAGETDVLHETNEGTETLYFSWLDTPITSTVPQPNPLVLDETSPLLSTNSVSPYDQVETTPTYSINNINYNNSDHIMSEDDSSDNVSIVELPYGHLQSIGSPDEQYMVLYNGNAEVVGNFRALNFYKASDVRIKEDIRKLIDDHDCRDALMQIDGVTYRFKRGIAASVNKRFVGFIAQQVESVVPEAVQLIDGILHVDYQALIPYMSESVKQNYRDISSRLSETEGMRVIVDTLYSNYITAQPTPDGPVDKTVQAPQNHRAKRPWWHWLLIAVIGVALFAAGGGLMVFLNNGLFGPQHTPNTKPPVPIATLIPAVYNDDYAPDRQILIDLFNATDGPNWILNKGWTTAQTMCKWPGIECKSFDDVPRVIGINLSTYGLNGTIPEFIGNLTALTYLDLSFNYLQGTIPKTITNIKSLNKLVLSSNDLCGEIWPEFLQLSNTLTILDLSFNAKISGGFPEWIPRMGALTNLYLQSCNLSGTLPPDCLSGPKMWGMDISDNNFVGVLPPKITITGFKASRNHFEGSIPPTCSQELSLAGNKLTGSLDRINCATFAKLNLSDNMLVGAIAGGFFGGPLNELNLANNNFSSVTPNANPPTLTSCDFSNNALSCPLPDWAKKICNAVCT